MITINDILNLVKEKTGANNINPETDIFSDLGCVGDDFHELIDEYAKRFSIDMSGYLWFFHADEEGISVGGLFFKPPYEKVKRIPITPTILLHYANEGKWSMKYPAYKLPKRRFDLIINLITVIVVVIWIILTC